MAMFPLLSKRFMSIPSHSKIQLGLGVGQAKSTLVHFVQFICFHCLFLVFFFIFLQGSYCRFDLIFLSNCQGFNYPPEYDCHLFSNRNCQVSFWGEQGGMNAVFLSSPSPSLILFGLFPLRFVLLWIQFENSKIKQANFS